jgi:hypothetical protein
MQRGVSYLKSLDTNACQAVLVRIQGGQLSTHWFDLPNNLPPLAPPCVGSSMHAHLDALQNFSLPDTVFLMQTKDMPDFDATETDVAPPIFHFCTTSASRNILVESFVMSGMVTGDTGNLFGGSVRRAVDHLRAYPPPPWKEREDVLFAAWSSWGRAGPLKWHTMRLDENRRPDAGVRVTLERVGAALNDSSVRINLQSAGHPPMFDWARYKYLLFADGITCSNKLWEMLYTGSLLFVEQSGYQCLAQTSLQPYVHYIPVYRTVPQELGEALTWARNHPVESERIAAAGKAWAEEFLTPRMLECRWQLLLEEYNRLLKFDVRSFMP